MPDGAQAAILMFKVLWYGIDYLAISGLTLNVILFNFILLFLGQGGGVVFPLNIRFIQPSHSHVTCFTSFTLCDLSPFNVIFS